MISFIEDVKCLQISDKRKSHKTEQLNDSDAKFVPTLIHNGFKLDRGPPRLVYKEINIRRVKFIISLQIFYKLSCSQSDYCAFLSSSDVC